LLGVAYNLTSSKCRHQNAVRAAAATLQSAKELVAAKARELANQGQALMAVLGPSQTPSKGAASLSGRPK
jgi:hypothetical protein